MISNSAHIGYKDRPVLLDRAVQDICRGLKSKFSWLDNAFGRAYKLTAYSASGERYTYPAIYTGGGEYMSVLPNDNFGNFSWFEFYDPQVVSTGFSPRLPEVTAEGAIVFWLDLHSIFDDSSVIYSEEVKNDILSFLSSPGIILGSGSLMVTSVYESVENLYRGYSLERAYSGTGSIGSVPYSIDRQYFMYPYYGFRFEFKLKIKETCL
jgi:hypothetical protein